MFEFGVFSKKYALESHFGMICGFLRSLTPCNTVPFKILWIKSVSNGVQAYLQGVKALLNYAI